MRKNETMTLCELSNELTALGYPDLFDGDENDYADVETMTGDFYDNNDMVVEFAIDAFDKKDGEINFLDMVVTITATNRKLYADIKVLDN